jgi:predicted amino acid racemase
MIPVRVYIKPAHVAANARLAHELCARYGIDVWGVTKAVAGQPDLAQAMLDGGCSALAETRLTAVARMHQAGVAGPFYLLRSPAYCEVRECVALTRGSLVSDRGIIDLLASEAAAAGKVHEVVVMADLDTGREGFAADELPQICQLIAAHDSVSLLGLGIYFEWQGDADEQAHTLSRLARIAGELEPVVGAPIAMISGGSTSIIRTQLLRDREPVGVTNLRLGTAILLGIASSIGPLPIPGFYQDTFVLECELNEVKRRGRRIGLLSMGHTDADPDHLFPLEPGVKVLKAFSDHTLVDLEDADPALTAGSRLRFHLGYFALTKLMHSPWVDHVVVSDDHSS